MCRINIDPVFFDFPILKIESAAPGTSWPAVRLLLRQIRDVAKLERWLASSCSSVCRTVAAVMTFAPPVNGAGCAQASTPRHSRA
jgi:hypothetical protein